LTSEAIDGGVLFDTNSGLDKRIENCRYFLGKMKADKNRKIINRMIYLDNVKEVVIENAFMDLKAGRFAAAQRGAEKYRTIVEGDPRLYFLLGEIARQRGGEGANQSAKAFYEKAISMDPSYPDPHRGIGLIYYKEGQCAPAKRSFEALLSILPQPPDGSYIHFYLKECDDKGTEL